MAHGHRITSAITIRNRALMGAARAVDDQREKVERELTVAKAELWHVNHRLYAAFGVLAAGEGALFWLAWHFGRHFAHP